MNTGIRQKLLFGLGGLLVIVTVIGLATIRQIDELGRSLGVVLKQNYLSVVACQDMMSAMDKINIGILQTFTGEQRQHGERAVAVQQARFQRALDVEMHNITLPGEQERAEKLHTLADAYFMALARITAGSTPESVRRQVYHERLVPLGASVSLVAQEILEMNQSNMISEKNATSSLSVSARWRIVTICLVSLLLASLLSYQIHRWVFNPLRSLMDTTDEIRRGNLDVVLQTESNDEIGRLSRSFNAMLISLRQSRHSDMANLVRSRRLTEELFRALPVAAAVVDSGGTVTVSTEPAERIFGLKAGVAVRDLPPVWLRELVDATMSARKPSRLDENSFIQQFVGSREYFFRPEAVPIVSEFDASDIGGVILILNDVTLLHDQQQMKHGMVSVVSHQLRTPLTSLRMSIHLLLEEDIGALNVPQTELLVAAREDCERLVDMIDDLLDLNRIGSGKAAFRLEPFQPLQLVRHGLAPFLTDARDRNVDLVTAADPGLPEVLADIGAVSHVFANLVSNALRFTMPGGTVTVGAMPEGRFVRFYVEDTGSGIASEHLGHLFEQFFRVPGQDKHSGAGLGLSIVKELVESQGGTVISQSQEGKGSRFSFTLPVVVLPGADGIRMQEGGAGCW